MAESGDRGATAVEYGLIVALIAIVVVAALILLGGTGFNEVYLKKLTFGAELWSDYFALLVWGFGAEATRDSVTSTLRGWGTPVDSKTTDVKPYSA